jgi:uncharacterized membrane protein
MNKIEYFAALKSAMIGMPANLITDALNAYELRFVEGLSAGRTEAEIVHGWDDPKAVAAQINANTQMSAFKQDKSPRSLWRLLMALIGLTIFNLFFLLGPVIAFFAILLASFVTATAFFIGGSLVAAVGVSGVNAVSFDDNTISFPVSHHKDGAATVSANHTTLQINKMGVQIIDASSDKAGTADERNMIMIEGGDNPSRTAKTFAGLGMILGGILLFLLSLVITKYAFIGIKRYVEMNISVLRSA